MRERYALLFVCPRVFSQTLNFSFGTGPGFPLNKTTDFTNVSYHLIWLPAQAKSFHESQNERRVYVSWAAGVGSDRE